MTERMVGRRDESVCHVAWRGAKVTSPDGTLGVDGWPGVVDEEERWIVV